jgi:hypothetical protein
MAFLKKSQFFVATIADPFQFLKGFVAHLEDESHKKFELPYISDFP